MGGDHGPSVVVPGVVLAAAEAPDLRFMLHGDEPTISTELAKHPALKERVEIRHADRVDDHEVRLGWGIGRHPLQVGGRHHPHQQPQGDRGTRELRAPRPERQSDGTLPLDGGAASH